MMDRSVEATIKCLGPGEAGGGRLLLRLGHCRRRQRHAARRVHPAGTVGRNAQAALQEAVRLDPRQHRLEGLSPLLRLGLPPAAAFHRGGHRHPQPGADLGRQHGPGPAEARVRRPPGLLGRRLRYPDASSAAPRRRKSASTSRSGLPPSAPAAVTSSTRSTTSRPTSRRKTSSPCSTRPTSSAAY